MIIMEIKSGFKIVKGNDTEGIHMKRSNETLNMQSGQTSTNEKGEINMNMNIIGSNALKIENKLNENEGDNMNEFKLKLNKFDIYFGINKNEKRERAINEKRIKAVENLKAVEADREKQFARFLGDL